MLYNIEKVNSVKDAILMVNNNVVAQFDNYIFISCNLEEEKEIILLKDRAYINKLSLSIAGVDTAVRFFKNLISMNLTGSFVMLNLK
ncbi:MAG: hypothetical protein JKY54_01715 [Flavobacteriales bacterium]|nr:hypothetical protein [Flavobacteriales bacterium]